VLAPLGLDPTVDELDQLQAEFAVLMAPRGPRVTQAQADEARDQAIEAALRVVMTALLADPEPRADGAPFQDEDFAFRDAVSGVYLSTDAQAVTKRQVSKKADVPVPVDPPTVVAK
jgi:hypothetical protein